MKEYTAKNIRNIALVSHSGAGKTMLAEALLHFTGATTRLGKIEDGSTVSDFEEEEIRRTISLSTAVIPLEYKNHKINLLDTPGFTDFVGEMISALRVADGAVVVVDAVAGAEVGTEIAINYCHTFNLPRFVLINKMNRDTANFRKALDSVQELTETRLLPVQLPWGEKESFEGVIDLLSMKALPGTGAKPEAIPAAFAVQAEEGRMELMEAAAEGDDELLLKYIDGEELSPEEVLKGLRATVLAGSYIPVFVSAATEEIGLAPLLDAMLGLLPSPAEAPPAQAESKEGPVEISARDTGPLAAYVWKTTADPFVGKITYFRVYSGILTADSRVWNHNKNIEERLGSVYLLRGKEQIPVKTVHAGDIASVPKLSETATGDTLGDKGNPLTLPRPEYPNALFRVSVTPKTQGDSTKMGPTLTRLCEEDMTLSWGTVSSTKQTILRGMGSQHIEVAIRKAEHKFQVGLLAETPKIPYQETITKSALAQYRHKKQTGGAGQFGEVHLRVEPYKEDDFIFAAEVVGGAISHNYMASIEKGIRAVMRDGVVAGYPVHNVKVAVVDGKEHPVDSKPVAFEIAGREAFKLAIKDASPVLLEPIMNVRVTVPEANMGDILGDLNTRRARVQGMDTEKGRSVISAQVPLAEMLDYTNDLRSMTGGRGVFTMEESHYDTVPSHITQEIIAAAAKHPGE